jgi:hypothetical protein
LQQRYDALTQDATNLGIFVEQLLAVPEERRDASIQELLCVSLQSRGRR